MNKELLLNTQIEYLKGVGPQRSDLLKKELNIFTFNDLLHYFPFRYVDRTKFYKINEIDHNLAFIQIKGTITSVRTLGAKRAKRLVAILQDDTGSVELVWFKGVKWIADWIKKNEQYVVFGKPTLFNRKINIAHPEIELTSEHDGGLSIALQPIYNTTEKLKKFRIESRAIAKLQKTLVARLAKEDIQENLPDNILEKYKFADRFESICNIHFPKDEKLLKNVQSRLKFEELFFIQLELLQLKADRKENYKGHVFTTLGKYFNSFYNDKLSFELTKAQKKVLKELRSDVLSGKQMNRLLQGDVGSGKTVVALMAMLMALDNNFQACMMAPTEILANQHYNTLSPVIMGLGINIELLTGSIKGTRRKEIFEKLVNGDIQILIGTHAVIEDDVKFKDLGIVIIDEQHRFGVEQRGKLWTKSTSPPHVLIMTATPIPRTLALTLYGDLDTSVIDEMPPGRKPVTTVHRTDAGRLRVFGFMKEQIKLGRQIYVVYPLIEESEKMDYKDLMDGYESIVREFSPPEYQVSIVHGRMKSRDKEYEMQRFQKGETQIMVATTVIEVGIDIPNASVMIIESAQRFGLSQLHQLRGRVGRGADQSYCILMTDYKQSNEARTRIKTMTETNDGFRIAEVDLKLRGPGDIQGTQQSGLVPLRIANLAVDGIILKEARVSAMEILDEDPHLENSQNIQMKKYIKTLRGIRPNWSKIS